VTVRSEVRDESATWEASLRESVLDPVALVDRQAQADRLLAAEGAGHLVHDLPVRADGRNAGLESRPWRLDAVPYVLDVAVFRWLASAVIERLEGLEAVLSDLYGPRRLLTDGVVPTGVVHADRGYRLGVVGMPPPRRWLSTYAVDLVRSVDGSWWVVQDLADAPPGVGYAMLDRSVMSRVMSDVPGWSTVASLARYPAQLRQALAATSGAPSPRTVLLTGGIDHPSYVDHSYLATQLGVHLVEGADLVVRQGRLWLRTLEGLEPVDVLYRRMEDPGLDPLEVGSVGAAGVPGLLTAARNAGVALANAPGAGVVESAALMPWWSAAVHHLTGVELRLTPYAGESLATTPVHRAAAGDHDGFGALAECPVVLRMFVAHDGHRAAVLPGGSGRVLAPGDDPRVPTACVAKDVWVIGSTLAPLVATRLPQVDLATSVPTRAADALYWANRAAERAETIVRTVRAVRSRVESDPGLVGYDGGRWSVRAQEVLRAVSGVRGDDVPVPGLEPLMERAKVALWAAAGSIGTLLTESTGVREYLSVTSGWVLERLSRARMAMLSLEPGAGPSGQLPVDELDAMLVEFAAFAGLWNESVVRGPAWRIGDAGRRIERASCVLDLVASGFASPAGPADVDDPVDAQVIETLLAADESLVAYRRRHRSDVERGAAESLLVRDRSNPRSVVAALDQLVEHAHDAEWPEGIAAATAARDASLALPLDELVPVVRGHLRDADRLIVSRWFAAPVNPVPVVRRTA
jgi:uncharacterized circularly permuted ATP-grasp superfamily protein/uncharacterized alpha-E superfamily protein